jgi:hypothetical protein
VRTRLLGAGNTKHTGLVCATHSNYQPCNAIVVHSDDLRRATWDSPVGSEFQGKMVQQEVAQQRGGTPRPYRAAVTARNRRVFSGATEGAEGWTEFRAPPWRSDRGGYAESKGIKCTPLEIVSVACRGVHRLQEGVPVGFARLTWINLKGTRHLLYSHRYCDEP